MCLFVFLNSCSTPLYRAVHWFFSCSGSFYCSCVFFLGGFSWKLVAHLHLWGQSGTQNKRRQRRMNTKSQKGFKKKSCTLLHRKAPILPWMMPLPCHKPLSMLCHPICPNRHSGKREQHIYNLYWWGIHFLTSISDSIQNKTHKRY